MNRVVIETSLPSAKILQLVQGDITAEAGGAIINAANPYLQHGAGIAGAIVRRGGQEIQAESDTWVQTHGPVSHQSPAWTSPGRLPCRFIIHAVGPVWEGDRSPEAAREADSNLESCITGSLRLADELGVDSISIPAISTGIFGFPKQRAAGILLQTICNYFRTAPGSGLQVVRVVLFDSSTLTAFERGWHDIFDA